MAYSDYDLTYPTGYDNLSFTGGSDGTAVLHSALSSPLTLQDTHCREWRHNIIVLGARRYQFMTVKGGPNPTFVGIADTKIQIADIWFRLRAPVFGAESCISLNLKTSGSPGTVQWTNGVGLYAGYSLNIANGSTPGAMKIGLVLTSSSASTKIWYPNLLAISPSVWYQMRLKITPIETGGVVDRDLVEAFYNSGTEASPVWTSIFSQENLASGSYWTVYGSDTLTRVGMGVILRSGSSGELAQAFTDTFRVELVDI